MRRSLTRLLPQPSTINHQPSTLNPHLPLQRHPSFHFLDDIERRWAHFYIFQRKVGDLLEFLPVGMRILPTGFGPHFIDQAIILGIQKGAGHRLQHPVAVFIDAQIRVDELLRLQPKVFRNTLNIRFGKKRPGCLATIGAGKTVRPLKLGVVQFLHHIIQVARRLLSQFLEVLPVFVMLIFGQARQLL